MSGKMKMSASPRILAFDSSGSHCAAALLTGGRIVAARHEEMGRGQAERLFPMLEEVLAEAGAVWNELDAIGVGVGPGNFTGIRIAVSAARGLSLALGIPAVGVSSFEALRGDTWYASKDPMIVSLAPSRTKSGALLQYFEDGVAVASPWEEGIHGHGPNSGKRFETAPMVLGHEAAAFGRALTGNEGGCLPLAFEPRGELSIQERIARVAALKLADTEKISRPSPLYIRPADAAPASDPPPVILP